MLQIDEMRKFKGDNKELPMTYVIPEDIWRNREKIMSMTNEYIQENCHSKEYIKIFTAWRNKLNRWKDKGLKPYRERTYTEKVSVQF